MSKNEKIEIQKNKQVDEKSGLVISAHLRIFDPESKQILINKRA